MTGEFSRKIKCISFLAMYAVMVSHSFCSSEVESFVIPWLTSWHVPWFLIVSGFFFSLSVMRNDIRGLLTKKVKSLLLPYLLWCIIGCCFWKTQFPNGASLEGNVWGLRSIFGVANTIFPIGNWPLWFTRALMIFMFFTLVSLACVRIAGRVGVPLGWKMRLAMIWIVVLTGRILLQKYGVGVSPGGSPIFFLAGFTVAEIERASGWRIVEWHGKKGIWVIAGCVILYVTLRLTWSDSTMWRNVGCFLAVTALWLTFDFVRLPPQFDSLLKVTPFVYFMHGPFFLGGIREQMRDWFGGLYDAINWNVMYVAIIIVMPTLMYGIALAVERFMPRTYRILSGGR